MKRSLVLSFAVLTFPAVIAAQNSSPAAPDAPKSHPPVVTTFTFNGGAFQLSSCPVTMQAKQGSGSGLVMVRKQQPNDTEPPAAFKPGQRIHLILGKMPGAHPGDSQQITSATVTVKGLSARDHFDLALDQNGNGPSDLKRTLNIAFSTENDGSVSADLNLPGFTVVNSVRLVSVDLKDGSTWTIGDLKTCVVTPDRMMLVANH